jgi:hypothetical protein
VELFLNSAWLALIAGAVLALLHKHRVDSDWKPFVLRLGSLICAAVLLFPTISITDDLHLESFVVEDSNSTKRLASAVTHAAPVVPVVLFGLAILSLLLAMLGKRARCVVNITSPTYKTLFLTQPVLGRAPPAILAV